MECQVYSRQKCRQEAGNIPRYCKIASARDSVSRPCTMVNLCVSKGIIITVSLLNLPIWVSKHAERSQSLQRTKPLTTPASPPRPRQPEHVSPFPTKALPPPPPCTPIIDRSPAPDAQPIPRPSISILNPTLRVIRIDLPQLDLRQNHAG